MSDDDPGSLELDLTIQNSYQDGYLPDKAKIESWLIAALKGQCQKATLCIRVVDEAESAALNQQYRHKEGPTNILSFLYSDDESHIELVGDLVMCAPIIEQEAQDANIEQDYRWAHMTVHGALHLLGFDHQKTDEAEIMEQLEVAILQQFGFSNPYQLES